MRQTSGWMSHTRRRLVIGLVAGITLMLTLVLSSHREGFGQLSSDQGPAQEAANGLQHVPPAAPSFMVLYSFHGTPDGAEPGATLVRDAAGNLYGTTRYGGAESTDCGGGVCGTVFKLSPAGVETILHSFNFTDGSQPFAGLIRDAAGNLYGTTSSGGAYGQGLVFRLSPTGTETVLSSYGGRPTAGLVRDAAGNLYGTFTSDKGGVYELFRCDSAPSGYAEKVLHRFTGSDGANPYAGLIRDAAGNLYGTTELGGATFGGPTSTSNESYGCGVVFKLSPAGTETVLHSFTGGSGRINSLRRFDPGRGRQPLRHHLLRRRLRPGTGRGV
jgi:uncharacterized repeat protein (TIGR03803 family)